MATATANFTTGITVILAATLLLAFPLTAAQSMAPAPVPSDDCSSHLTNVSDCLTYVEAQSNLTKPDKGCCPEFAGLVDSHPICLCELLKNSNSFGIQINVSKALMLPSVCGVTTPPLSACSAIGVPVASPGESPSSNGMSPGGSASSPSSGNNDSGTLRSADSPTWMIIGGLAVASLATLLTDFSICIFS